MTEQQEQLVLTMLAKLVDAKTVIEPYYDDTYTNMCIFCGKESNVAELIIHSSDCVVRIAKQLKETLQQETQQ